MIAEDQKITTKEPEPKAKAGPAKAPRPRKKKKKKIVNSGLVYIQATYNNTIVTITDPNGDVLDWSSAGRAGFKGPKKATPYAAGVIVRQLADRIKEVGLRNVNVFVKGVGSGREAAIRALAANGLNILTIKDITPIPHNGCRPPKIRRV